MNVALDISSCLYDSLVNNILHFLFSFTKEENLDNTTVLQFFKFVLKQHSPANVFIETHFAFYNYWSLGDAFTK